MLMPSAQPRQPKGSPQGGRFASSAKADDPDVGLLSLAAEDVTDCLDGAVQFSTETKWPISVEKRGSVWSPAPTFETSPVGFDVALAGQPSIHDVKSLVLQTHAGFFWSLAAADMLNTGDLNPDNFAEVVNGVAGRSWDPPLDIATHKWGIATYDARLRFRQQLLSAQTDHTHDRHSSEMSQILQLTEPAVKQLGPDAWSSKKKTDGVLRQLLSEDWVRAPAEMHEHLTTQIDQCLAPQLSGRRRITELVSTLGLGTRYGDFSLPARMLEQIVVQAGGAHKIRWSRSAQYPGMWQLLVLLSKASESSEVTDDLLIFYKHRCPRLNSPVVDECLLKTAMSQTEAPAVQQAAQLSIAALQRTPGTNYAIRLRNAAGHMVERESPHRRRALTDTLEHTLGIPVPDRRSTRR